MTPSAQVYLLAAGNGRRAGGPKAWRDHEGRPLLERQLDFLLGRFEPGRVAVTIQESWRGRCAALNRSVHWVSVDPALSPLAALQSLIASCPQTSWAFYYHVDMPVWEPRLFDLLEGSARAGVDAVVPFRDGRKGHPAFLSPALGPEILRLDPRVQRLDHWLRAKTVRAVDADFACAVENWNA